MITISDLQGSILELSSKLQQSVKFDHLLALTDHNAVLQHAKFSVPAKREGYTMDDNARALVFLSKAQKLWNRPELIELQRRLLGFTLLMQQEDGKFHNFMNFSQQITDDASVGDHLGRAIWSTGTVINSSLPKGLRNSARLIFDKALPWARITTSPRTKAYACLGLCERLRTEPHDSNLLDNLKSLADNLLTMYHENRTSHWRWFEGTLTYDNPRLTQAMFQAYQSLNEDRYQEVAEESLQFLAEVQIIHDVFVPIGSRGWYPRGGKRAMYDQQPIEAGCMVEASALAHSVTGLEAYAEMVRKALGWFLGLNTQSVRVYDDTNGGCYDGIGEQGVNENQGSESTLAFLLASISLTQEPSIKR